MPERSAADDSQPGAKAAAGRFRGLITDWGGVLTNPIRDTVNAWLRAEGILQDSYFAVMRLWMRQAYAIGQAVPSATLATFPRDVSGAIKPGPYVLRPMPVVFLANLKVENNKLVAVRVEGQEDLTAGEEISAAPGAPCGQMQLEEPVDFLHCRARAEPTAAQARPGAMDRSDRAAERAAATASTRTEAGWRVEAAGI